jgi:tRNA nucleotidyltransferase (CCA-adding enzyme)
MSAPALAPPPEPVSRVVTALREVGHEAWLVGGCVRDRLQGRPVNDWDVATDAEPEQVLALFRKVIATGLQHGTVTVVEEGLPIEVTTFRVEEGYTDGRRPDRVVYTRDLVADLGRRDFTINAMAWDPLAGAIVDPYDGRGDLARRLLRAVGDPIERFTEDGLRPMRAVRFACVHALSIDPPTLAAIPATLDTFRKVAVERILVELHKTLLAERAAWGVETLRETGLLAEFLPEVASLAPTEHVRIAVALTPPPSGLAPRLAVLLHAADLSGDPLKRLRFSNAEREEVMRLLAHRTLDAGLPRTDAQVRALVAEVGPGALDALLAYRLAAARRDPAETAAWRALAERIDRLDARSPPHTTRDLAIDGRAVMQVLGERPSRRVGQVLDALLQRVFEDPTLNTPERLRALVPDIAASLEVP